MLDRLNDFALEQYLDGKSELCRREALEEIRRRGKKTKSLQDFSDQQLIAELWRRGCRVQVLEDDDE